MDYGFTLPELTHQNIKRELPSRRDAELVIVVVIRVVVDIEASRIKITNVDTVTIGRPRFACFHPFSLKVEFYCLLAYILSFLYFIREYFVLNKNLR